MKELDKSNGKIAEMFDKIALRYDFLNHLLSFNIDRSWRRKSVRWVLGQTACNSNPHPKILDLACGTGDLSGLLYKSGAKVTGADISGGMLSIAKKKSEKLAEWAGRRKRDDGWYAGNLPEYMQFGAEHILLPDKSCSAVTIAFGFRNFEDRKAALGEIFRVLEKGGSLAILEFAYPDNFFAKWVFNLYFKYYLPIVGKVVSKDKDAYKYLVESVIAFPKYDALNKELTDAGFGDVHYRRFTFGIACLYMARKG